MIMESPYGPVFDASSALVRDAQEAIPDEQSMFVAGALAHPLTLRQEGAGRMRLCTRFEHKTGLTHVFSFPLIDALLSDPSVIPFIELIAYAYQLFNTSHREVYDMYR